MKCIFDILRQGNRKKSNPEMYISLLSGQTILRESKQYHSRPKRFDSTILTDWGKRRKRATFGAKRQVRETIKLVDAFFQFYILLPLVFKDQTQRCSSLFCSHFPSHRTLFFPNLVTDVVTAFILPFFGPTGVRCTNPFSGFSSLSHVWLFAWEFIGK